MKLNVIQLHALLAGFGAAHHDTKKKLGQKFASAFGFTPGPDGPDDGIDGFRIESGRQFHFQCKLCSKTLDKDEARKYYSDLKVHAADVSILLSVVGFKDTFRERLSAHPDIGNFRIHLLTLEDVFMESPAFQAAVSDLPWWTGLGEVLAATVLAETTENLGKVRLPQRSLDFVWSD